MDRMKLWEGLRALWSLWERPAPVEVLIEEAEVLADLAWGRD